MKLVALVLTLGLAVGAGYAGYGTWVEQSPPNVDEKQPRVAKGQPKKKDAAGPMKNLPAAWLHDGPVLFAAFLPDGKQVVTASPDGNLRLWEYPAGKEIRRIAMPEGSVRGMLALSADGKMIATANLDETEIYVHDLATGRQRPVLKWAAPEKKRGPDVNSRLAFSPNGEHLAALDRAGVVSIWDWAKGKEIRNFATSREDFRGIGLAYAPDGKSILTIDRHNQLGNAGFVKTWDPATSKEKCTLYGSASLAPEKGRSTVIAVGFSPDSKSLAICTVGGIVIVDTATGKQRRQVTTERQTARGAWSLARTAPSSIIASSTKLWSMRSPRARCFGNTNYRPDKSRCHRMATRCWPLETVCDSSI
jgi:WD40 repeat protein